MHEAKAFGHCIFVRQFSRHFRMTRRNIINILAVVGALSLLGTGVRIVQALARDSHFPISLRDDAGAPIRRAAIFIDRGDEAVERFAVDSTGTASILLTERERRHTVWLICAPGFQTVVGRMVYDGSSGVDYTLSRDSVGATPFIRTKGWRGPMPRECPQAVDSVGWYVRPMKPGETGREYILTEPNWTRR
jgi:hypothetical protein